MTDPASAARGFTHVGLADDSIIVRKRLSVRAFADSARAIDACLTEMAVAADSETSSAATSETGSQ